MQTRERTRKRHRNTTKKLSRVTVNTSTHPKNLAQRSIRVVLLHRVATHTDKDHQRQHVKGTAQDADTETNVRGHRELRQYTWRTDAKEHQSSASNPWRKKKRTHMKFALPTMCEHNTRPTWHMTPPQTNQLCFGSRCVTSRYFYDTLPRTQTLFCPMMLFPSDMTQIMTDARPHATCFRNWHDTCTTTESIPRRHELTHITMKESTRSSTAHDLSASIRTNRGEDDPTCHVPGTAHA